MESRRGPGSAEEQARNLLRFLSREVRKGMVEGAAILAGGLALLGWSLATRSPSGPTLAAAAAFWSSLPVVVLGVSYFVRSYADSQVRRRVESILHAIAAARTAAEDGT